MPKLGPTALLALLFTIVVMFSLQGRRDPGRCRSTCCASPLPLLVYFALMFGVGVLVGPALGFSYRGDGDALLHGGRQQLRAGDRRRRSACSGSLGEALAAVVGPLIEVPALVALVYVSLWLRGRLFTGERKREPAAVT